VNLFFLFYLRAVSKREHTHTQTHDFSFIEVVSVCFVMTVMSSRHTSAQSEGHHRVAWWTFVYVRWDKQVSFELGMLMPCYQEEISERSKFRKHPGIEFQ
jgi:hypothetical protein